MKRRIAILLVAALLVSAFSGCNIGGVKQTNEKLVIWKNKDLFKLDLLFDSFKGANPDINFIIEDYKDMEEADFATKLKTELIAGKGPDVIFMDSRFALGSDLEKMMRSGAFADLEQDFQSDDGINMADYNQTVMDAGVVDGKRYIVPLFYSVPLLITTQELLDQSGVDLAKCGDYFSFAEELDRFMQTKQGEKGQIRAFRDSHIYENMYEMMGLSMVNYTTQSFDFSMPEVKRATQLYQRLYVQDGIPPYELTDVFPWLEKPTTPWIFNDNFKRDQGTLDVVAELQYLIVHAQPVFFPIRSLDGGVSAEIKLSAAVNNASPNKENARRFIKFLLSDIVQTVPGWSRVGIPVKKDRFMQWVRKQGQWTVRDPMGGFYSFNAEENKRISEKTAQELNQIFQDVTSAYFPTPINGEIYKIMKDYWKGKASFEQCAEQVTRRYEMYMSE